MTHFLNSQTLGRMMTANETAKPTKNSVDEEKEIVPSSSFFRRTCVRCWMHSQTQVPKELTLRKHSGNALSCVPWREKRPSVEQKTAKKECLLRIAEMCFVAE
mmetsp:Transcript_18007/g.36931  ORF Transcript_18007/g.36931 Transcript_18007/m.36931 type:complete len:103 (+) Transcript_18007:335-643(+)